MKKKKGIAITGKKNVPSIVLSQQHFLKLLKNVQTVGQSFVVHIYIYIYSFF